MGVGGCVQYCMVVCMHTCKHRYVCLLVDNNVQCVQTLYMCLRVGAHSCAVL